MQSKILALIPARAGSKGVPGKNVRLLAGHPLLAYSIAVARNVPEISRVVISTDSEELAAVGRRYGAEAPFLRPAEFATDTAKDIVYIRHAIEWFKIHEKTEFEQVVLLRPTTPLRNPSVISDAISVARLKRDATALRSGHELSEPPQKMFKVEGGYFVGLFPGDPRPEYYDLPRQSFASCYKPNGYVDILRPAHILSSGTLHGPKIAAFITEPAIEVDTAFEFNQLEYELAQTAHSIHTLVSNAAKTTKSL